MRMMKKTQHSQTEDKYLSKNDRKARSQSPCTWTGNNRFQLALPLNIDGFIGTFLPLGQVMVGSFQDLIKCKSKLRLYLVRIIHMDGDGFRFQTSLKIFPLRKGGYWQAFLRTEESKGFLPLARGKVAKIERRLGAGNW